MDLSFISKQKTKKQDEELKDDQPLEETIQVKQLSSYETLFDSEGAPTIKIREDDILGPILMYVDLDLYTGTWKGSVLLLVPISVQTPTVEFYDSQCNSKFMGSPVKIGQYQQSVFYRYDFSVPLDDSIDKRISYQINGTSETYVFTIPSAHTNHEMSREHGLVSIDTRFERSLERIVSEETYNQIFDKLEDMPPSTRHLFVLMGIPIIYPRLTYVEEAMGFLSRSSLIKMNIFQKEGAFSKLLNDFGEPELLDDLNDHWTAGCHLEERKALVLRLQELSNHRKVRVTFVAGDVHCCGVGCFKQSNSEIPEVQDFRYMPQIISSAIVNSPPPNVVIRLLHLSSKKYTLDNFTYEKMVDLFVKDVNGKNPPNNNKKLLGRRNYASFEQISDSQNILVKINVQNETNNGTVPYEYKIAPLQLGNVI
ncbi:hypothetical protein AX774_g2757 [Zancudomyces culisetae]|uniref:PhoD-like phosphatase domain-containing protein n=1 Tax=Zancudomyces culisetae TaxID=1213189 RepID=A0A1R1PS78_ZANCU|nr:hypothetical protein AX774_g2757 [Zancudomyces culisetae]|eukprot:OMH83742.1 hypothetical protein AX774_g2757 [Zancudomyces culisetae]